MNKMVKLSFGIAFLAFAGVAFASDGANNCATQYPNDIKQQNVCNSMYNAAQNARNSVVSGNTMSLTPGEQKVLDQGLRTSISQAASAPSGGNTYSQGETAPAQNASQDQNTISQQSAPPIEQISNKGLWNRLTAKPPLPPVGSSAQNMQSQNMANGSETGTTTAPSSDTTTTHVNIYK
jgi:hypothetical protein